MQHILGPEQESELLARGFSRRDFFKVTSLMGAAASMPFFGEAAVGPIVVVRATKFRPTQS